MEFNPNLQLTYWCVTLHGNKHTFVRWSKYLGYTRHPFQKKYAGLSEEKQVQLFM